MTKLNLLGAEKSANVNTQFLGTEHLYDLGMIYKGCKNSCLSVIQVPCESELLSVVTNTLSAVILSNSTIGSKVQVLYDPADIELAFIKLSLALKSNQTGKVSEETNNEIIDGVPYDINGADKITLLVCITDCSEAIINKLIAQANEGNVVIYIVTNNKQVADAFIDVHEEGENDKDFVVTPEVAAALESNDFSNLTKSQALECPNLFSIVKNKGKEYIALSVTGKEEDTIFFDIGEDDKLKIINVPGDKA